MQSLQGSGGRDSQVHHLLSVWSVSSPPDKMEMVEFVQANPVLFAKEHVHYFHKVKKDRLWEEIGSCVGRSGQDVKRWFDSQLTRCGKLIRDQAKSG